LKGRQPYKTKDVKTTKDRTLRENSSNAENNAGRKSRGQTPKNVLLEGKKKERESSRYFPHGKLGGNSSFEGGGKKKMRL